MKLFCPNCGSPNEANPGTRVTCFACSASFDAPAASAVVPPVAQPIPPPTGFGDSRPANQAFGGGGGYAPAPSSAPYSSATTNPLAIASIPVSLICCAPVGIGLGAVALSQIGQSGGTQKGKELAWAGIVIGTGMLLLQVCLGVFSVLAEVAK